MLNHALRVLFCIAPPSHCAHGQILIDKSRIRNFWSSLPQDLDQKSGALSENRLPHLNGSFFLRGLFLHKQKWSCSSFPCITEGMNGSPPTLLFFTLKNVFRAHLCVLHGT